MIKPVTGRAVHKHQCWWHDDDDADADIDNNTRQTEHDCIGSLPNEPKSTTIYITYRSLCLPIDDIDVRIIDGINGNLNVFFFTP